MLSASTSTDVPQVALIAALTKVDTVINPLSPETLIDSTKREVANVTGSLSVASENFALAVSRNVPDTGAALRSVR